MSYEERNTWLGLVVGIVIMVWIGSTVRAGWLAGDYAGAEGLTHWAGQVSWMIAKGVAAMIVAIILSHILYGIVTGGEEMDTTSDERDTQIDIWGLRTTQVVTSLVFIGGLITLSFGHSALVVLNIMLFGFWLGSFLGDAVKVVLYRLGA